MDLHPQDFSSAKLEGKRLIELGTKTSMDRPTAKSVNEFALSNVNVLTGSGCGLAGLAFMLRCRLVGVKDYDILICLM